MMLITVGKPQRRPGHDGYSVRVYFVATKRRTWRKVGLTLREAQRNRQKLQLELAGRSEHAETVTVKRAITQFRRARGKRVTEQTRRDYGRHCARWAKRWGQRKVDQLTVRDMERHFRQCESLDWSNRTLNLERTLLRAFFQYCRDRGWLVGTADPMRTIRHYREALAKPAVILSDQQIAALLRACRETSEQVVTGARNGGGRKGGKSTSPRVWKQTFVPPEWLYPVVLTGLRTLLRLGDILDLQWRHVDTQARLIRLAARETKGGAEVEIPVGADLLQAMGRPGQPHERVFPTAPEKSAGVTRRFNKAVERAGIPRCTFHDLRKTGATQLLRAGVPLKVVQDMGGWLRPDVLLKHYTQSSLEDKQKAAEVLGELARCLRT